MDLAKNALLSTVPDELSMNRSDSDRFFLKQRVCMFSNGSHKTTDTLVYSCHEIDDKLLSLAELELL